MTKSYNSPFEHVDYNAIIDGTKGNGIISGLTVTERGAGQNMSVDVAAGSALISWVKYTEASTVNVVITAADATHPRKDIIIYDVATTNPAVVTGTPAAEPIPPDITSGDILLAIVNVAANETTIANTDIEDGGITVQNYHHTTHETGGVDEVSNDATMTNQTGSRAFTTVYQNTGTKMMFVMVTAAMTGNGSYLTGYVGPTSSPGAVAQTMQEDAKSRFIFFIVPAGYYYKVVNTGNGALTYWYEYTL